MSETLPPGSKIGILGGGQLGRMLAMAAARLGLIPHIYDPAPDAPAGQVAALTSGAFDDIAALQRFARAVDVITYEFENIPEAALDAIEGEVPIRPNRKALATSQDRLVEKNFLTSLGLKTAPYADATDLSKAVEEVGLPGILKTRTLGYDGKGQLRLKTSEDISGAAMNAPAILEGFVDFSCEISVIAARGLDGSVSCFDPGQNVHKDGILHTTTVPATVSRRVQTDAVLLAGQILTALDYVGVMGVELFVTRSGLLVNEIAPRVHNSGHWTQNACSVDQFEQHIRAIAGWSLGDGTRFADVVMTNLIGDDVQNWAEADGALHLYGKAAARAGRKMGHVNVVTPRS